MQLAEYVPVLYNIGATYIPVSIVSPVAIIRYRIRLLTQRCNIIPSSSVKHGNAGLKGWRRGSGDTACGLGQFGVR